MNKPIKKMLIDLDLNVTQLAEGIGKSRPWTSLVVNGSIDSPATRKLITEFMSKRSLEMGMREMNPWPTYKRKAA